MPRAIRAGAENRAVFARPRRMRIDQRRHGVRHAGQGARMRRRKEGERRTFRPGTANPAQRRAGIAFGKHRLHRRHQRLPRIIIAGLAAQRGAGHITRAADKNQQRHPINRTARLRPQRRFRQLRQQPQREQRGQREPQRNRPMRRQMDAEQHMQREGNRRG